MVIGFSINSWGSLYIQKELFTRTQRIRAICDQLGLETLPSERSAKHIVGIKLKAEQQHIKLAAVLKSANIYVSVRSETIRIAPHLHTDEQDIERFCSALEEYLV